MTTKVVNLIVTSNLREYPYEKRYPSSLSLHELKVRFTCAVDFQNSFVVGFQNSVQLKYIFKTIILVMKAITLHPF